MYFRVGGIGVCWKSFYFMQSKTEKKKKLHVTHLCVDCEIYHRMMLLTFMKF